MPGRQRTSQSQQQTAAPTVAPAQAGPGVGNSATQASLGLGGVGDVQATLRERTESVGVRVGGQLPPHLLLGEQEGNRVTTGEATGFSVGVDRGGIFANFSPALEVRPGSFWARMATGGVTVSSLYFSFASGRARVSLDTGLPGDILDVFMDLKEGIEGQFSSAIQGSMPARLRTPGYDPYTDPDLAGLLRTAVNAMGSAFPKDAPAGAAAGPGLTDQITRPTITASVKPKAVRVPLGDKLTLILDPSASLDLTAAMRGTMGQALAQPKVDRLDVRTDGISIEHDIGGKLANIDLRSLSFASDLSLTSLDYGLGLESTIGALKALGMLLQLRTGQDLGIRDVNSPELTGIRAMIDDKARAQIPTMIREQIRTNDRAIPGFTLSSMFDL
jgi:hypothetical protein